MTSTDALNDEQLRKLVDYRPYMNLMARELLAALLAERARLREMEGALRKLHHGDRRYGPCGCSQCEIINATLAQPAESGAKEAAKSTFSKDCCWPGNCHGGPSCMSEKPTPAAAAPPAPQEPGDSDAWHRAREIARKHYEDKETIGWLINAIDRALRAARASERERCAKIADHYANPVEGGGYVSRSFIADAIREAKP